MMQAMPYFVMVVYDDRIFGIALILLKRQVEFIVE